MSVIKVVGLCRSSTIKRGYTSIARVLDAVCLKAPEFTYYSLYRSLATSQSLNLSTQRSLSSSHLLSCMLVVVRVNMHNPSVVVTLLAKHVGDCDSEGLQGHACEYATRPIAKMPRSDGDGFCLAAPLLSHRLRCADESAYRLRLGCTSTVSSAALISDVRANIHLT